MELKNKKKILLAGFQPYDNTGYPPTKCFIDLIAEMHDLSFVSLPHLIPYSFLNIIINPGIIINHPFIVIKELFNDIFSLLKDIIKFKKKIKHDNYDILITKNHLAFAIASFFFDETKIIFWCYDYYSYESDYYRLFIVKKLLQRNKKSLEKGSQLIIQDENRLAILERVLGIELSPEKHIIIPVFLDKTNAKPLKEIFGKKPIIMQCGSFHEERQSLKLLSHYQNNDNYVLYYHGINMLPGNIFLKVRKVPIVSTQLYDKERSYQVIDYCDIGFIGYTQKNDSNYKYMAYSSGQLAMFLRKAKPVISMGNNDIGLLLNKYNAGVEIQTIDELNNAIDLIVKNYKKYSSGALDLFNNVLSSDLFIDLFSNLFINKII